MNNENIEEILKSIGEEDIPADVHKIAQETSNNFSSSLKQTRQPKQHILLEQIMKSRIAKLAAAAVIIIAVLLSINIWDKTTVTSKYIRAEKGEFRPKVEKLIGSIRSEGKCWSKISL